MREYVVDAWFTPDRMWPADWSSLQLYITPDPDRDSELGQLFAGCNAVFAQYPMLVVPERWRHITVQPINHVRTADIGQDQRAAFAAVLTSALSEVPAWTWTMGSPVVSGRAALLDTSPDEPFELLLDAVRRAVGEVFGSAPLSYDTRPAHMTLCYPRESLAFTPAREVRQKLRRVRPSHAPLRVGSVHLVDVHQDADAGFYWWDHVHTFCLGGSPR